MSSLQLKNIFLMLYETLLHHITLKEVGEDVRDIVKYKRLNRQNYL